MITIDFYTDSRGHIETWDNVTHIPRIGEKVWIVEVGDKYIVRDILWESESKIVCDIQRCR
jgi:hypothetical protein